MAVVNSAVGASIKHHICYSRNNFILLVGGSMRQGAENPLQATKENHALNASMLGYLKVCLVATMKHPAQVQPPYSMAL